MLPSCPSGGLLLDKFLPRVLKDVSGLNNDLKSHFHHISTAVPGPPSVDRETRTLGAGTDREDVYTNLASFQVCMVIPKIKK